MTKSIRIKMPETLNLEERAELALNAMIGVADEDYEYIPYFSGFFQSDPAWMSHGNWDYGSSHGRLVDSILLARRMTASRYGEEVEQHYRENLLKFFRSDGLNYRRNTFDEETAAEHQAKFRESASMIDQRSVLLGLTTWFADTNDEEIKAYADRHVAALKRIARKERISWYYPASEYTESGWPSFDAVHTRLAYDPAAMWGRQIMPLIRYFEITGNKDAYELSENFASGIMFRSGVFNSDGSFNDALIYRNGHFHTRMGTLNALTRFAEATDDSSIIAFVKKSFDWGLTKCTNFGWTPGDLEDQEYEHETCTLVDAISIAITLAKQGYSEYWGVAERFIRNHLTEAQILDTGWIKQREDKSMDIPGEKTYYKVAERLRGTFAGYAAPNDFVYSGVHGRGHIMDVQTCCVASGTRGLYNGWENIVTTHKNGRVSVNMLLNRATEDINVLSYLPHEGKVELYINRGIPELLVRIPEWTPFGAVQVERGSGEKYSGRDLPWVKGCFILIKGALVGEKITVTFMQAERETVEMAAGLSYGTKWVGDEVVGITPKGTYYPLYSGREVKDKAPLKTGTLHIETKPGLG